MTLTTLLFLCSSWMQLNYGLVLYFQNGEAITPTTDTIISYVDIYDAMSISFDITLNTLPSTSDHYNIFQIGNDTTSDRYPAVFVNNEGFIFSLTNTSNYNKDVVYDNITLTASTPYSIDITYTQASFTILLNGLIIYNDTSFDTHLTPSSLPIFVNQPYLSFIFTDYTISNILIHNTLSDITELTDSQTMDCDLGTVDIGNDISCALNVTYHDDEPGQTTTLTVQNTFNLIDSTSLDSYCSNPRITFTFIENDFSEIDEYINLYEGATITDPLIQKCGKIGVDQSCITKTCMNLRELTNDYSQSNSLDITVFVSKDIDGIDSNTPYNDMCSGGNTVESVLTLTCQRERIFPDNIVFEHLSTESFNGDSMDIGWMEFTHCKEGYDALSDHQYNGYTLSQMIDIAKYAITVKFLPSSDTIGVSEDVQYAVKADICSNAMYALNNGYEMSYTLNTTTSEVISYGDISDWIGDSIALNRFNHTGYTTAVQGELPVNILDGAIFGAYGNVEGFYLFSNDSATWNNGIRCEWDWMNITGQNITMWLGFDQDKTKWCEFRDDTSYGLSSDTSCDDIYGGEWSLVRHTFNMWHSATDNLSGTASYGTYDNDPKSGNIWSIPYDEALYGDGSSTFMFSNGDCSEYLITTYDQISYSLPDPGRFEAQIITSHYGNDYTAEWENAPIWAENPWISWQDHDLSNYETIIYGEASASVGSSVNRWQIEGADLSANVWLKITEYFSGPLTSRRSDAISYCVGEGATLATINSVQEFELAKLKCMQISFNSSANGCWIGLNDLNTEGTWEWADETPPDYGFNLEDATDPTTGIKPWSNNSQPDGGLAQNCVHLHSNYDYRYHDIACDISSSNDFLFILCNKRTETLRDCVNNGEIDAWYDADSMDLDNDLWRDKSGNNNNGIVTNNADIHVFAGVDTGHELYTKVGEKAVWGSSNTQIRFIPDVMMNHTVFNLCKYRDIGQKKRILQTDTEDSVFGFWNGFSGVASENGVWITTAEDRFGSLWVLSTQQQGLYRGNFEDYTVDNTAAFNASNKLMINEGLFPLETSNFACNEIIIINNRLGLDEIQCIEEYFADRYALPTPFPTTSPTLSPIGIYNGSLDSNGYLYADDRIMEPNLTLIMQTDGNLVLYSGMDPSWVDIWSPMTTGAGNIAIIQEDGNFVVYDSTITVSYWSSGSIYGTEYAPYTLIVTDNNIFIQDKDGNIRWHALSTDNPTPLPTIAPTIGITELSHCIDAFDIDGWYDGESMDIGSNLWRDKSPNNNDATITSAVGIGLFDGVNTTHELYTRAGIKAVYGSTATQILFPVNLNTIEHTVFNYCKYREFGAATKTRILQTDAENGVFGFWNARSGQAHENEWITDGDTDHFGDLWVLSSQQWDLYRGNLIDLTVNPTATFTVPNKLGINQGLYPTGISDFSCAEIIIINIKLNLTQIQCIESYLDIKYNPTSYPTAVPSVAPTVGLGDLGICVSESVIEGWYDGNSMDIVGNVWRDKSGHNNDATITSNVGIGVFNGTNTTHELYTNANEKVVYGTTDTKILFNAAFDQTSHTIFNLCKYRADVASTKMRILQADPENGVFGHYNTFSGKAYEQGWITDDTTDYFGDSWVLSSQQHDLYRGNLEDLTLYYTASFTTTNKLAINEGAFPTDSSDFACAEIIVINQKLALNEIECIEDYLQNKHLQPGYRYIGCYTDSNLRALNAYIYGSGYTVSTCHTACVEYKYFAVQSGDWCSCSNSYTEVIQYGSSVACSGGVGGAWANDVYQNLLYIALEADSYIAATDTWRIWSDANDYCIAQYGTSLAVIDTDIERDRAKYAIETSSTPYDIFWIGMNDINNESIWEWVDGTPCSSGNCTSLSYWVNGEPRNTNGFEDCAYTDQSGWFYASDCSFTARTLCEHPTTYDYDGCYNASAPFNALDVDKGIDQTIQSCQELCISQYQYFILKDDSHCFCGYDYDDLVQYGPSVECVNGTDGVNSLALYQNVMDYTYIGCYAGVSAMEYNIGYGYTLSMCHDECSVYGYRYFAIRDHEDCWCGNSLSNATQYGIIPGCQFGLGLQGFADRFSLYENVLAPSSMPTFSPTLPTTVPTIEPTNEPTNVPTNEPTVYPTNQPTNEPTNEPTYVAANKTTNQPTNVPTVEPTNIPTNIPTVYPTIYPTVQPTTNPTSEPTIEPSMEPNQTVFTSTSSHPTTYPSTEPTLDPTDNPSHSLTTSYPIVNVSTPFRRQFLLTLIGDYDELQRYLNDSNSSMVVWAKGVIQIMIDISMYPELTAVVITINNVGRGSIVIDYKLEVGVVALLDLAEKNINSTLEIKVDTNFTLPIFSNLQYTLNPTQIPTSSPIPTNIPTTTPTGYPTPNPTTSRPTNVDQPVFNASFPGSGIPLSDYTFLGDPYGRFQAYIEVSVYDKENALGVTALCTECFIWQYRLQNAVWIDIDPSNDDDISVYNKEIINTNTGISKYESQLTIQSIRRLNAGNCFDETDDSRIFKPGNTYELRLKFLVNNDYFVSQTSNAVSITTNALPSGGYCVVENIDNLNPLQQYNLYCDGWDGESNIEYNALLKDVLLSKTFEDDATLLTSIAPVGEVEITVLIKEQNISNSITCYPINAVFKSITDIINAQNGSSVDQILSDVSSLTNATSFSDNPDVAIALITVIEDIYRENLTTQNEAAQIVDNIVSNIIGGSGILDIVITIGDDPGDISWVVLDGHDIVAELTTISAITSNTDIIGVDTTTATLIDTYLPQIFEAIDVFADISLLNNHTEIQDVLYVIAGQSQDLITNLESTLQGRLAAVASILSTGTVSPEVIDNMNNMAQSLVEYATMGASKALSHSGVGESFNYDTIHYNDDGSVKHRKSIIATKFDADVIDYNDESIDPKSISLPKCGQTEQNIELPLSFMKQQNGLFDCALMSSSRNNFISKQVNRSQESETVSIDLFDPNKRRRLIEFESNECFPYLITMALSDPSNSNYSIENIRLGEEVSFPSCDFWNTNSTVWDTSGCFVYALTDTSVTCGCTHLTTFSLSDDKILPEANILSKLDWHRLTPANLTKYPTVWLTCLLIFLVFLLVCWINPRSKQVQSRSILAYEDIIYKSYQEEVLYEDIVGLEIEYISRYLPNQHSIGKGIKEMTSSKEAKKSICQMQWKLFRAYLRNEHTLVSVFQRTAGTNFSLKQRLGCFFMYLANIMMVTGTFYGLEQSNPVQDVFASLIISLCGTIPVTIVRNFFVKSKPGVVKSVKHRFSGLEDDDKDDDKDDDDKEGNIEAQTTTATITEKESWRSFDMEGFLKDAKKENISMRHFTEKLGKHYDKDNNEHKIRAMSQIRNILFKKLFPLPYKCKQIGWIVLIIWSMTACIVAIVYGLSFDISAQQTKNDNNANKDLYQTDCWNTTLALQIEAGLSKEEFLKDYLAQETKNTSSYAGGDSASWLLSIFQSLFQSILLWQPMTAYITTWIKVWLFTWHLKMELGPGNIIKLCKRCCIKSKVPTEDKDEGDVPDDIKGDTNAQMLYQHMKDQPSSTKTSAVISHQDRPFDLISFLGNSTWIINDLDDNNDDNNNNDEVELQTIAEPKDKEEAIQGTAVVVTEPAPLKRINTGVINDLVDDFDTIFDQGDGEDAAAPHQNMNTDGNMDALLDAVLPTMKEEEKETVGLHQNVDTDAHMDDLVDAVLPIMKEEERKEAAGSHHVMDTDAMDDLLDAVLPIMKEEKEEEKERGGSDVAADNINLLVDDEQLGIVQDIDAQSDEDNLNATN